MTAAGTAGPHLALIAFAIALQASPAFCDGTTSTRAIAIQAVPFTQVTITDKFWAPRKETNRTVSLPHSLDMLEKAGNIKNLKLAAAGAHEGYSGPFFIDSDLYKALEAVSYSLASTPDPALEKRLDEIIEAIAAAQQPDGYINTWFTVVEPDKRWTNLRDKHELYCAGHLIEAAVAHHAATGKRTLLDVAIRFADYIDSIFGDEPGKRMGYPGHEEIELALFKLWRATGEQRYYDLAAFFLDHRGTGFFAKEHDVDPAKYNGEYWQDNVPLRDTSKIVGHAVRAVYLLSGATDYAAKTRDPAMLSMLDRVWDNTTHANRYVTGGIGSSAKNEGFTHDFDLPNFGAYQETCASVAMIMWNHRLNLLSGDSKYVDTMERALYNGFLSGVSLDGKRFFYVNPLASRGHHHRAEWYSCACCPPNVTRTLAQLGGYMYATSPGALWVNLYAQGSVKADVGGTTVGLNVETNYPWDGKITLKPQVTDATPFQLRLRIPRWSMGETIAVNGEPIADAKRENGYVVLDRTWQPGDQAELTLPLRVMHVMADSRVKADVGKLAIQRGPVVYCLEACDQDAPVHQIAIAQDAQLKPEYRPDLLGGVTVLTGAGEILDTSSSASHELYTPSGASKPVSVMAIPYYAWDNRKPGDMAVWIPVNPPTEKVSGPEDDATVTISFKSNNCNPDACRDGIEIINSAEQYATGCHWWPHKGGQEWVQYSWKTPQTLSSSRVYWLDDTGKGECRIPKNWHIEYRDGDQWKPVKAKSDYPAAVDQWCRIAFEPVETTALRMVVEMQPGFSAGVHEWKL